MSLDFILKGLIELLVLVFIVGVNYSKINTNVKNINSNVTDIKKDVGKLSNDFTQHLRDHWNSKQ